MPADISSQLSAYFDGKGISQVEIAAKLQVSKAYVNSLFTGRRPFGKKQAEIWESTFGISKSWLLTGEGKMLRVDPRNEVVDLTPEERENLEVAKTNGDVTYIPLIHVDSVGGIHSQNALTSSEQYVERMIPFPDARPGDVAILQSGNSMAPTIPAGAILQIRRVEGWREYFGYGGDFVLWLTDDRRITKQVLKYGPDPKNYVTCHSYNPEVADEELPRSMIQEVWKVVNVLINKGW